MGATLGWIALALSGLGITPQSEREKPPITYTVRMIEADGVGWREAVFASSQAGHAPGIGHGLDFALGCVDPIRQ